MLEKPLTFLTSKFQKPALQIVRVSLAMNQVKPLEGETHEFLFAGSFRLINRSRWNCHQIEMLESKPTVFNRRIISGIPSKLGKFETAVFGYTYRIFTLDDEGQDVRMGRKEIPDVLSEIEFIVEFVNDHGEPLVLKYRQIGTYESSRVAFKRWKKFDKYFQQ